MHIKLAVFLLALLLGTVSAQAETVNCTPITSAPFVITAQGVYCLTAPIETNLASGNAIEIQTNNVVLDLNGFKLGNLGAGLGTLANGIFAQDRQNITIKNGTIRGFLRGIFLHDTGTSQGHLVEDIRAHQNTTSGIQVRGDGNVVRNDQVMATGGSTCCGPDVAAFGILVAGVGPRVLNNDVSNTVAKGTGMARGIHFESRGLAVSNRITGADVGIEFDSSGKYRANLTSDVTTPFVPGIATNAGNNN